MVHDGYYATGRFCSSGCARKFSTRDDKKAFKFVKCNTCKTTMEVDKRSPANIKCDSCKSSKVCGPCGQIECIRPEVCKRYRLFPSLEKYFGFDITKKGTREIYKEYDNVLSRLEEDYYDDELSISDMVEKYGHYDCRNFDKILNCFGIKKRDQKDAQFVALKNGKFKVDPNLDPNLDSSNSSNSNYLSGWHTTWIDSKVFLQKQL